MRLVVTTPFTRPETFELVRLDREEKVYVVDITQAKLLVGKSDWEAQKAVVVGRREYRAGDIEVLSWMQNGQLVPSGCLRVYLSPTAHIKLAPDEWSGTLPDISVDQEVIDATDQTKMTTKCQSIVAGELTLWP